MNMDDYLGGRIDLANYLGGFGIDVGDIPGRIVGHLYSRALSDDEVTAWCELGLLFGTSQRATPILCGLLGRDDHARHEDVAKTLQDLRDPGTVECLFTRVGRRLEYLEYNDNTALACKCIWALHDIGTPDAIDRLRQLAHDPREEVSREVAARLEALSARRPDDAPPYRLARDRLLGPL